VGVDGQQVRECFFSSALQLYQIVAQYLIHFKMGFTIVCFLPFALLLVTVRRSRPIQYDTFDLHHQQQPLPSGLLPNYDAHNIHLIFLVFTFPTRYSGEIYSYWAFFFLFVVWASMILNVCVMLFSCLQKVGFLSFSSFGDRVYGAHILLSSDERQLGVPASSCNRSRRYN